MVALLIAVMVVLIAVLGYNGWVVGRSNAMMRRTRTARRHIDRDPALPDKT